MVPGLHSRGGKRLVFSLLSFADLDMGLGRIFSPLVARGVKGFFHIPQKNWALAAVKTWGFDWGVPKLLLGLKKRRGSCTSTQGQATSGNQEGILAEWTMGFSSFSAVRKCSSYLVLSSVFLTTTFCPYSGKTLTVPSFPCFTCAR